ncbi:toll/interleukin-1 receptor domain-containing protein [Lentzea sp. HUAS TT2]|uniref:toll/interleukin-1 receptor domain-containing protein n=1 Tax=Lentzea sp. HUAS TT2 TaxID=3447454 RepID=UPI003F71AE4F
MSDVSTFFSYAHIDDAGTHGRLKKLSSDIGVQYRSMSGFSVDVFFDAESIPLGDRWRQRIEAGLTGSTVLFAIISPAYLRSPACRDEIQTYLTLLDQEQRRMLIPLLLYPQDEIDRRFSADELWLEIKELQYRPIQDLRFEEQGSRSWMTAVIDIASRVDEVVGDLPTSPVGESMAVDVFQAESVEPSSEISMGTLEVMAIAEERLPELGQVATDFSGLIDKFNEETEAATSRLSNATSFREKLQAANTFARKLQPITSACTLKSQEMRQILAEVAPGVTSMLRMIANSPGEIDDQNVRDFLNGMRSLVAGAIESTQSVALFHDSMEESKGFSGNLDHVLIEMQNALLVMVDLNATAQAWKEILNLIDEPGQDVTEGGA